MVAENEVRLSIPYFTGQKSGVPRRLAKPTDCLLLENFIVDTGELLKSPGISRYYQDRVGTNDFQLLTKYDDRIVFKRGRFLFIETAKGSKQFEVITGSLNEEYSSSDKWLGSLYLSTNSDLFRYDNETILPISILPPGNGKAPRTTLEASSVSSGGNMADGTYRFTFTLYDSVRGIESLPYGSLQDSSGVFNTEVYSAENPNGFLYAELVASSPNNLFTFDETYLEDIVGDVPSNVDTIRKYRTVVSGTNEFFFEDELRWPLNGVAFRSSKSDADLGELLITDFLQPFPSKKSLENQGAVNANGFKYIKQWRDQLFAIGLSSPRYTYTDPDRDIEIINESSTSIMFASDVRKSFYAPFNYAIGEGDDQDPTGLAVYNNVLCIFKERSIYTLIGNEAESYVPKIIDDVNGCVAPRTLVTTPYGVLFLSSEGFMAFDGYRPAVSISDDIRDIIKEINFAQSEKFNAKYDEVSKIYRVNFATADNSFLNKTLYFKVDEKAWGEIYGQRASMMLFDRTSDNSRIALLGSIENGVLFDLTDDSAVNNDGNTITATLQTVPFDFGIASRLKRLDWLFITCRATDDFNLDIFVYDQSRGQTLYSVTDVSSNSGYALYGTAIYGEDFYGGKYVERVLKIPISGVDYGFIVEVQEKSNDSDIKFFKIIDLEITGEVLDR